MSKLIVIAAGGTGGHFFPAEALAQALDARGYRIALMTDKRAGERRAGIFSLGEQFVLPGAGVAGRGPVRAFRAGIALLRGALEARRILRKLQPSAMIGFGGYPSVPPLLGARLLGSRRPKLVLHEGNAVLGKANAFLSRFADAIATSFPKVEKLPPEMRTAFTGMPLRPTIAALAGEAYPPLDGQIRVLVWGGSLGARVLSEVVPDALASLPADLLLRLEVTQQARAEDEARVRKAYEIAGIPALVKPFFTDVAGLLRSAHLVIGRAGGSSVAELLVAGRPAILVPLPIAASDEQTANARSMEEIGAGWIIPQPEFTVARLSAQLEAAFTDPTILPVAAAAAATLARPDAAERLADLVEACLPHPPSDAYATDLPTTPLTPRQEDGTHSMSVTP